MSGGKTVKNKTSMLLLTALVTTAPVAFAAPRPAQKDPMDRPGRGQASEPHIIAVQAYVENTAGGGRKLYGIAPNNEPVPARIGDHLKISLVGTDVSSGVGREVALPADFDIAAGRGQAALGRKGNDWAEIDIRAEGQAQLGYTLRGSVNARPNLTSGRLTFDVASNRRADDRGNAGGPRGDNGGGPPRGGDAQQAQKVTDALYRAILNQDARGRQADDDVNRIAQGGWAAVREVAHDLAQDAERRGLGRSRNDRGYQEIDAQRVGGLYQRLLGRKQSTDELWARDSGFRRQVQSLHEDGLDRVVLSIVDSDEFANLFGLNRYESRGDDRRSGRRGPG
jgi:hypothetical protein